MPTLKPTPGILEIEANLNSELTLPHPALKEKSTTEAETMEEDGEQTANDRRLLEEFDCEETIELMYYNRCNNVISDHKPVRAVLNVKIKK